MSAAFTAPILGDPPRSAADPYRLHSDLKREEPVIPDSAAARRHKLGWHLVMALVRSWSELVAEHRRGRRCRVLLVDETPDAHGTGM